jgi:hypothetical protein
MQLPAAHVPPAQLDELQSRVAAFELALRYGQPTPSLALTADEINILLETNPGLQPFKDKLRVSIVDGHLEGLISISLADLGLPFLRARHLNGKAIFTVLLEHGRLRVVADQIYLKGKPLPALMMRRVRQQNLAEKVNQDPRASIALEQLQAIEVKDGKLWVVPRAD